METDVEFDYLWFNRDVSSAYDEIGDIKNRELRKRIHEIAAFNLCYYVGRLLHHLGNLASTSYQEEVNTKYAELLSSISEIKREFPGLMDGTVLIELDKKISELEEVYSTFYHTVKYDDFRPEDEEFDWFLGLRSKIEFGLRGIKIINEGVDVNYSSIMDKMDSIDKKLRENLAYIAKFYVKKKDKKHYRSRPQEFWWYSLMFNDL